MNRSLRVAGEVIEQIEFEFRVDDARPLQRGLESGNRDVDDRRAPIPHRIDRLADDVAAFRVFRRGAKKIPDGSKTRAGERLGRERVAIAAPVPPIEPPGLRDGSYGFRV